MNPLLVQLGIQLIQIAAQVEASLTQIRQNDPAAWAEIQAHAKANTAAFDAARPT